MMYANPLFQYFIDRDIEQYDVIVTHQELEGRFPSIDLPDILQAIKYLIGRNLIDDEDKGWRVSAYGRNFYKEELAKQEREEKKHSQEFQKLQLEISALTDSVADYPKVRQQAKWAIIYAGVSALAAIAAILIALLK